MLPPEPLVLEAREGFTDAQFALTSAPSLLGLYQLGWYGTDVSDEVGSFGLVNPTGPLYSYVGNRLQLSFENRSVSVYIIGSYTGLDTDIAITRRSYLAISLLALDPVSAYVSVLS